MEVLLQNNKIRAATHNIMAYRIERPAAAEGVAPTFLQVRAAAADAAGAAAAALPLALHAFVPAVALRPVPGVATAAGSCCWRSSSSESAARASVLQDFDDDGEDAAGGRLLHLLQLADVRNVSSQRGGCSRQAEPVEQLSCWSRHVRAV